MLDMLSGDYTDEICPDRCRDVWRQVIVQALRDASGEDSADTPNSGAGRRQADRWAAREWIKGGGPDFRLVCELAGVDAEKFRKRFIAGEVRTELARRPTAGTIAGDKDADKRAQILEALRQRPNITTREVVSETGMTQHVVTKALTRLRKDGVIEYRIAGRGNTYLWRAVE